MSHSEITSPTEFSSPPGKRILVVDDHEDSSRSLELMLQAMGHETQVATDGIDALRKANAFLPDIVFLDLGMPKLDGYDTCGVLRAQPWGTKVFVVAVTGLEPEAIRSHPRGTEFDYYLRKPVEFSAIQELVAWQQ